MYIICRDFVLFCAQGDSGGPMSCLDGDTWYVAGITSWGVVTCQGLPGVYTRVSKYWEWIELTKALNAAA